MVVVRILAGVSGVVIVLAALSSAIRTFILPRASTSGTTRFAFTLAGLLVGRGRRGASPEPRAERRLALHAPLTVLLLPGLYVTQIIAGYTLLFITAGKDSLRDAFTASGSSLTTLGFADLHGLDEVTVAVTEAVIGLGIIALVIAYLPTMYGAFQRREALVSLLEVRAGSPPSAVEMLTRFHRIGWTEDLDDTWSQWETWFSDIEESHTSLGVMSFFRSPDPTRHWVAAAGAVLDAASLTASTVAGPPTPRAGLCIRAGYIALRRIADQFGITYDPDPSPDDPISIGRFEYDEAYDQLVAAGVPVHADRDQAWRDFAGWRVNYDPVLLSLAAVTAAPYAPWVSDRSRVDAASRVRPGSIGDRLRLRA